MARLIFFTIVGIAVLYGVARIGYEEGKRFASVESFQRGMDYGYRFGIIEATLRANQLKKQALPRKIEKLEDKEI